MPINPAPLHTIDLIRKKRDGGALDAREIGFMVAGATSGSIPAEQLAAWLMAAFLRGLSLDETRALTLAMRDSDEKFSPARLGKVAVDKHSTGGVGDKTSFLVAPIAAACGLAVPMISGRALGHTGGTLDKLESIPGYRTTLSLEEFETVLSRCGASIVGQTPTLVPADRVLYALRDRTGTVESPGLICAFHSQQKIGGGLDALVLDVKTGSGAFLRKREDAEYLAALMVATAEAAGTRTVALLTDMDQPLGRAAGNWIEIAESRRTSARQQARRERRPSRAFPHSGRMDDSPRRPGSHARGRLRPRRSGDTTAPRCASSSPWSRHRAAILPYSATQPPTSPAQPRCSRPGNPASSPRWILPQSAGPSSAQARAVKKPENPSIPMPAFFSTPAAALASKRVSPSLRSTPPALRFSLSQLPS